MKTPHPFAKPFPLPFQSIIFLLMVAGVSWNLITNPVLLYWTAPIWLFLPFFFWAERQEYKRESRLYRSWTEANRIWAERMANSTEARGAMMRFHLQSSLEDDRTAPSRVKSRLVEAAPGARTRARRSNSNGSHNATWDDTFTS